MTQLLSPLKIKDVGFRNRIGISPMCMYSAENGIANDWHMVHYGSRAIGGSGLIIFEASAVSPEGRISPGDLGIYNDGQIDSLKRINTFIHQQGSISGIQLAHAGRKAGCALPWEGGKQVGRIKAGDSEQEQAWYRVAPSAIAFKEEDDPPNELDESGIQKVINDFRNAAERSFEAGFKMIEIHAAHGYLIHEFLSPLSNHRKDNYGGSFENRIRLLLQIVKSINEVWPKGLPLFVRLSCTDWVPGGWDVEETVELARILKQNGVDLIDCSSGGMVPYQKIPLKKGFQVPFAERIKRETGILTGAVGMISTPLQAESILINDQADMVLIARESLRDPHFPLNAARELKDSIDWPLQYLRAK